MRVIDVHKLQKTIHLHNSQRITKSKVIEYCKEQPTVNAIPIEWLKKFAKQFEEREPEMSKPIWMVIEDVINFWEFQNDDTPDPNKPKDWRKENEID